MTVYGASYEPSGLRKPNGKIVGGATELVLQDETPDGGINTRVSKSSSGRPVQVASVPTQISWPANLRPQDYEALFVRTVSDRLRYLIEDIEPGVHQFIELHYVRKTGEVLHRRWFWQVCNRIDSVFAERPGWVFDRVSWRYPPGDKLIFDVTKSRGLHFWHEKHVYCGLMMSEHAMARLNEEDISGFSLHEYVTVQR
jgi:hypothetical protein